MKKGLLKKMFAVTMVSVMALSVIGCGEKKEEDMLAKIKADGKFTVGMSVDYAPYEFFVMKDGKKQMVGMDVDLLGEIAKDMGVKYEVKEMEFNAICESVANGMINMGVSGLSPDDERRKLVDFSDIYFEADQGILINKKDADKIKSIDDLKGMKVGAQLGSIQAKLAGGIENVDLKQLSEVPTLIQDLKAGNLDAVIVEIPVADIQAMLDENLVVAENKIEDTSGGGSAVAIPKNQQTLVDQVNKTLKRLADEGKIDEFYKNGVELSKSEVTGE